jgi:quinol-cytochrome oxidoreductase complex cytochrome b subunit
MSNTEFDDDDNDGNDGISGTVKGHMTKIATQIGAIYSENKFFLLSIVIFVITFIVIFVAYRTKKINIYWSKQKSLNKKCSPETSSEEEQNVSISPKKIEYDMYMMVCVIMMVTFFIFLIAYFNYASS